MWKKKNPRYFRHRFITLTSLLLIVILLAAGCSASGNQSTTGENKPEIVFGDFSWDSVQIHNRIAAFIIEHGYGYPVNYMFGETIPILQGLEKGSVDVTMEIWVDNVREAYQKALDSGAVKELGTNFPDAPQGWYVPTYVIKGDPARGIKPLAPELKSVEDLPRYWELFKDPEQPEKGRFYNSPPGWVVTDINTQKLKTYGLDRYFNNFITGSDTALATSIVTAYEQGKPWLGYYWEPTWIMGKLDMTMLEEPPYSNERWNSDRGCAFPSCRVTVAINSSLEKTAPEVVEFLKNYRTTLEQTNEALAYMHDHGDDAKAAAIWFLKQYPEHWKQWVPQDVADRVSRALNEVK